VLEDFCFSPSLLLTWFFFFFFLLSFFFLSLSRLEHKTRLELWDQRKKKIANGEAVAPLQDAHH
jgi:hypothetical protein